MTSAPRPPPLPAEALLVAPVISSAFCHGFSTRRGGVSQRPWDSLNVGRSWGDRTEDVAENRRRLLTASGARDLFVATQVHGADVVVVADQRPEAIAAARADALVSDRAGVALGVLTADCVPLIFADPVTGAFGVAHAGWRGTVAGVAKAVVTVLRERFGVQPADLCVAIGPSIGPCCFEVGEEVVAVFAALAEATPAGASASPLVARRPGHKPHVDLWQANRRALLAAGVAGSKIATLAACTACDPARFFSYRRDGRATGQHLSFIARA